MHKIETKASGPQNSGTTKMEQEQITTYGKPTKEDGEDLDTLALEYIIWYVFEPTQTQKVDTSRSFKDQCYALKTLIAGNAGSIGSYIKPSLTMTRQKRPVL
jgi:hypothetical protein